MGGNFTVKLAVSVYLALVVLLIFRIGQGNRNKRHTTEASDMKTKQLQGYTGTRLPRIRQETEIKRMPNYFGPGAKGERISIPRDVTKKYESSKNKSLLYGVNNFISDMIGIKRILPDKRPEKCKEIEYPSDLPEVSIVIVFREEPIASLLRTIYSVLETSPDHLIKEIILVDDGSQDIYFKAAVNVHVANVEKLKLLTNNQTLGLMRARQRGIEATQSKYFIVLDGHIEVTPRWLEPLLYRLVQEPNALLTSHIGNMDRETFQLQIMAKNDIAFMFFDQITLNELWVHYSDNFRLSRNGSVSPIPYGIVPGMMTAMRKDFFLRLGGFDPGMEIWGIEHMELSVKVWLCDGLVEMVPCSIIGHVYRQTPWQSFHPNAPYIAKNMLRFAHVWMDGDLQKLALQLQHKSNLSAWPDPGDLQDRHRIRRENNCKPYQYYIDKIRQLTNTYIPKSPRIVGVVRNVKTKACLDHAVIDEKFLLISYACSGNNNQFFVLTEGFNIRVERSWLTVKPGTLILNLLRDIQDWSGPEFKWNFEQNGTIKHLLTEKCLTASETSNVTLEECTDSPYQVWQWPVKQ
ncbi:polypeptide N-acetylgalactosaminyltransferase 13-like [Mercenaria mercenaria]|uniref:polypeptide N-acetylgalactosaminyltransferase 13-like n=1 Tax=Mercenaria mercenaria TaxID=6596 RepID=UPI00234EA6B4|nr:polypeptide N-acetylgalactosaminyltransferase 13-like [Mercenaria mercenaria]